jgi:hypothetical protein
VENRDDELCPAVRDALAKHEKSGTHAAFTVAPKISPSRNGIEISPVTDNWHLATNLTLSRGHGSVSPVFFLLYLPPQHRLSRFSLRTGEWHAVCTFALQMEGRS